jgi:hypothetical protein
MAESQMEVMTSPAQCVRTGEMTNEATDIHQLVREH